MEYSIEKVKKIYFIGGVWNVAAVVLFALMSFLNLGIFEWYVVEVPAGGSLLWFYMFLIAVLLFGCGYFMASADPVTNKNIIILGIIGKLCVFGLVTIFYFKDYTTLLFVAVGTVDMIFSIFFYKCLKSS